jgi:hypothetical protein
VDQLRVLLGVGPPLLRDMLHTMLVEHGRFLVIDVEPRTIDVLVETRRCRVDVVIATLEQGSDVPPLVTHLLAEFPEVLVVGVSLREQSARIYHRNRVARTIADFTFAAIVQAVLQETSERTETAEH